MNLLTDIIGLIPIIIMIGSLIITLVFCISGLFIDNKKYEKDYKKCNAIMTISFVVCIASMASLFLYKSYIPMEKKLLYKQDISAVEDTSEIHGSRYYITTDEYYKIIEINGVKKNQNKIPSNYTDIIEDGECKLYVYEQTSGYKAIDMLYKFYRRPNLYELHIPQNSVTDKYNIDLK